MEYFFGIEQAMKIYLKELKKGSTLDQVREIVKYCNELDIDNAWFFYACFAWRNAQEGFKYYKICM